MADSVCDDYLLNRRRHGHAGRVPGKYNSAVLSGFVIPAGAAVMSALNSAPPALGLSAANPAVRAALDRSVYWSSLQGLINGFLVLIVSACVTEPIDRNFNRAACWCLVGAIFSWVGLVHAAKFPWVAAPQYAIGWLVAAVLMFTARWWAALPQAKN